MSVTSINIQHVRVLFIIFPTFSLLLLRRICNIKRSQHTRDVIGAVAVAFTLLNCFRDIYHPPQEKAERATDLNPFGNICLKAVLILPLLLLRDFCNIVDPQSRSAVNLGTEQK